MKILVVDFWSDANIGDAIMQVEILRQLEDADAEIHVVSCFGANQYQDNAFSESRHAARAFWHPAFFSTYISLDWFFEGPRHSRISRLLLTLSALVIADIRVLLYSVFKFHCLLGRFRTLSEIKFDGIVYNGRNYRNFGGYLKNYLNNRPLILHHKLFNTLFPDVQKLNAGYSVWAMDNATSYYAKRAWQNYLNVARESHTENYTREELGLAVERKKDLSFSYLQLKISHIPATNSAVGFILTRTAKPEAYLKQMNVLLNHFVKQKRKVFLIEQVYLPHETTLDLEMKIECEFEKLSSPYIKETLDFYKNCEFVISTRMHGSIMALSQGCKVASLAYDDGAKWNIVLDEIPDYPIFAPGESNPNEILDYLQSNRSKQHATSLSKSISEYRERYVEEFVRNISTKA